MSLTLSDVTRCKAQYGGRTCDECNNGYYLYPQCVCKYLPTLSKYGLWSETENVFWVLRTSFIGVIDRTLSRTSHDPSSHDLRDHLQKWSPLKIVPRLKKRWNYFLCVRLGHRKCPSNNWAKVPRWIGCCCSPSSWWASKLQQILIILWFLWSYYLK